MGVTEADRDAAFEHSSAMPGAHLEASGRFGVNSLGSEEGVMRIQGETCAVRPEPAGRGGRRRWWRHGSAWVDDIEQAASDLVIVDTVETADQLDEIPSALASGETVPEVPTTIDDEGRRIVTFVDRTGANEPVATEAKTISEATMFEKTLDADVLFEPSEVELRTHQRRDLFRFDEAEPSGTLLPNVSK